MSSRLQEPGFQKRAVPISGKTWHWMIAQGMAPKRAELLRGEIIEKMSKSITHIKLASRIFALLQKVLPSGFWVRKEDPITTIDSEPEPDVSVVAGTEADYFEHPTTAPLVVEVSVSTLAEDREMATIYAEAGVKEFWIVNAAERCVEQYSQPNEGRYQKVSRIGVGAVLHCTSLPEAAVDVSALFANLPE
jgi:Uma2 family endonuclease